MRAAKNRTFQKQPRGVFGARDTTGRARIKLFFLAIRVENVLRRGAALLEIEKVCVVGGAGARCCHVAREVSQGGCRREGVAGMVLDLAGEDSAPLLEALGKRVVGSLCAKKKSVRKPLENRGELGERVVGSL